MMTYRYFLSSRIALAVALLLIIFQEALSLVDVTSKTLPHSHRQLLSNVEATFHRELKAATSKSNMGGHQLRQLQNDGLSFDQVCAYIAEMMNSDLTGYLECSCVNTTNALSCTTPTPVCDNATAIPAQTDSTSTNDIGCAYLSLEMVFLSNYALSSMEICVDYTDESAGAVHPLTGEAYRDGCMQAGFGGDGTTTTIESCGAQFVNDSGELTDCSSCEICVYTSSTEDGSPLLMEGTGFFLDCSNIIPGAISPSCFAAEGTLNQGSALFPTLSVNGTDEGGDTTTDTDTDTTTDTDTDTTTDTDTDTDTTTSTSGAPWIAAGSWMGLVSGLVVLVAL